MAWKYGCCSKIFGIICFCKLFLFSWYCNADDRPVSQYDREIQQSTRQLNKIRTELEKGRKKLKGLQLEEGNYLAQLEQIEKNIAASQAYLATVSGRIDTVETLLARLSDSLAVAERRLAIRQNLMSKRLQQAYLTGSTNFLMIILSAKSPVDVINKVKYLEKVNRYDRELARQITAGKTTISEKKAKQHLELEYLSTLREAKETENDTLVAQEQQRKKMLVDIRKEKTSYEAMVTELERSQKELVSMLKLLEKKRKKARETTSAKSIASFEKKRGSLPWPVEGPVITKFGKVIHPEYQTVIMSNGIDIGAQKGDAVHCIAAGTVIHTGWLRGLGKMVIVDHVGGYLTIYAHLASIDVNVDEPVTADTILGKVGDTGSLGGTRMHFEVRKSSEALNPIDWLEKR